MNEFRPGDRVFHERFGLGTVQKVETQRRSQLFHVAFDRDSEPTRPLNLRYNPLRPATTADEVEAQRQTTPEFFSETFVQEQDDDRDSPGSHWTPFFDDGAREALLKLPEYLNAGLPQTGFGAMYPAPYKPPRDWPVGLIYSWPIRNEGVQVVVRAGAANTVKSVFPFSALGTQHTLRLDKVHVHKNGVQAQIEGALGPAIVRFFDSRYLIDRAWYRKGETYEFVLCGLAYECRCAETQEFEVKQSAEVLAKLREHFADEPEIMKVSTAGMAALLPVEDWGEDDWDFRGPVKSVKETRFLDQPAWRLRVTVMRQEQDIDLEILVTGRAWKSPSAPVVGEDVEGRLWLQGTLWHAHAWHKP